MGTTVLSLNDVSVRRGDRLILGPLNFSITQGERWVVLGPNGAGKTTTFYMCVGVVAPDTGSVTLNGSDVTKKPMYARAHLGIGYLPQEASVFRKLTVRENVLAILETMDFPSSAAREDRLKELLEELGLYNLRESLASALSGGERRRVEIARCLARNPQFILLDEPFAGIDPLAIKDIQELISSLQGKGIGVLITDHNVRETLGICSRAYILVDGRVLEEGSPSAIANSEKAKRYYLGGDFRL